MKRTRWVTRYRIKGDWHDYSCNAKNEQDAIAMFNDYIEMQGINDDCTVVYQKFRKVCHGMEWTKFNSMATILVGFLIFVKYLVDRFIS